MHRSDSAFALRHPQTGAVLFSRAELACRGSGKLRLGPGFAARLLELRLAHGRPMIVTSCCRSRAHNAAVGGHPRSLHVCDAPARPSGGTLAIDIAHADGAAARDLLKTALDLDWSAGLHQQFLHLDCRDLIGLPRVVFTY